MESGDQDITIGVPSVADDLSIENETGGGFDRKDSDLDTMDKRIEEIIEDEKEELARMVNPRDETICVPQSTTILKDGIAATAVPSSERVTGGEGEVAIEQATSASRGESDTIGSPAPRSVGKLPPCITTVRSGEDDSSASPIPPPSTASAECGTDKETTRKSLTITTMPPSSPLPLNGLHRPSISASPTTETAPSDIRALTIKNLDTGEQFIIGENDPDFEFDTFAITGKVDAEGGDARKGSSPTADGAGITTPGGGASDAALKPIPLPPGATAKERATWWKALLNLIYGSKASKRKAEEELRVANERITVDPSPKTPFTKLSSFRFRKELGRGAFGRVLLAEAKQDGKLYALKIISKKNMRSSDKRQAKAERDILYAMALKAPHPFTSGLKFAFQSENNLYLGMDFIPGGNLRELIKKYKRLPEEWVRFFAAELILAISHLHSLNVLYRDIKPHNVMIDAQGHAILIDFGLSKQEISHPRGALSLVGTPDYSAPEVLKTGVHQIEEHNKRKKEQEQQQQKNGRRGLGGKTNKKNSVDAEEEEEKRARTLASSGKLPKIGYGKAADWWSLGIMIYEMLSGTPTFRGADLRQTYQRILFADLEFRPEERFSAGSRQLLTGLIQRDPSKRLGSWSNPPEDIMSSPFFNGIEWDAIYERRCPGPFIPESVAFSTRKSSVLSAASASVKQGGGNVGKAGAGAVPDTAAEGGAGRQSEQGVNGRAESPEKSAAAGTVVSPLKSGGCNAPMSSASSAGDATERNSNVAGAGASSTDGTPSAKTPALNVETGAAGAKTGSGADCVSTPVMIGGTRPDTHTPKVGEGVIDISKRPRGTSTPRAGRSHGQSTDLGQEDLDDDEDDLMRNMRDSLFIHSKGKGTDNRLLDWSFIDEQVLLSTMSKNSVDVQEQEALEQRKAQEEELAHIQEANRAQATGAARAGSSDEATAKGVNGSAKER